MTADDIRQLVASATPHFSYQIRNRIKVNNSSAWITVPLERGSQSDRICDKLIRNDGVSAKEHWQRRTWATLQIHYGKAPYFREYAAELEDLFTRPWSRLLDVTLHILDLVRGWFGITRPLIRSSSLDLEGQKTDRIIDFCRRRWQVVRPSITGIRMSSRTRSGFCWRADV